MAHETMTASYISIAHGSGVHHGILSFSAWGVILKADICLGRSCHFFSLIRYRLPKTMLLTTQASKLANLISSLLGQLGIAPVPSSMALAACAAISKNTGALTQTYPTAAKQVWWSNTDSDLVPACVVFPRGTDDVAAVVRILGVYPTVPFATKSGGHNPNAGFSSVQGGVLISLSWMNSTALSLDKKTAVVLPGARWADPITALEPYNVTVVGGRLGKLESSAELHDTINNL